MKLNFLVGFRLALVGFFNIFSFKKTCTNCQPIFYPPESYPGGAAPAVPIVSESLLGGRAERIYRPHSYRGSILKQTGREAIFAAHLSYNKSPLAQFRANAELRNGQKKITGRHFMSTAALKRNKKILPLVFCHSYYSARPGLFEGTMPHFRYNQWPGVDDKILKKVGNLHGKFIKTFESLTPETIENKFEKINLRQKHFTKLFGADFPAVTTDVTKSYAYTEGFDRRDERAVQPMSDSRKFFMWLKSKINYFIAPEMNKPTPPLTPAELSYFVEIAKWLELFHLEYLPSGGRKFRRPVFRNSQTRCNYLRYTVAFVVLVVLFIRSYPSWYYIPGFIRHFAKPFYEDFWGADALPPCFWLLEVEILLLGMPFLFVQVFTWFYEYILHQRRPGAVKDIRPSELLKRSPEFILAYYGRCMDRTLKEDLYVAKHGCHYDRTAILQANLRWTLLFFIPFSFIWLHFNFPWTGWIDWKPFNESILTNFSVEDEGAFWAIFNLVWYANMVHVMFYAAERPFNIPQPDSGLFVLIFTPPKGSWWGNLHWRIRRARILMRREEARERREKKRLWGHIVGPETFDSPWPKPSEMHKYYR